MKTKLIIWLVGFCSLFWVSTATAVNQSPQQWRFKVFLDDQVIGYHTVTLNPDKTRATVQIEANLDVKLLFFTAYRYRHNNQEVWRNNCLQTIESYTDDNGDIFYINGHRMQQGFALQTHDGSLTLPGCVRTFAYWDPRLLEANRLLNSQTGEYLDVDIKLMGNEPLIIADQEVAAKRYRLQADNIQIDLWYSDKMHWLALQTTTESGHQLRYQLERFPV